MLRKKVVARGARGILGLGRLFKIMDDDRSGRIDLEEFTKAMREYKLGIDESDIHELFKHFDTDHSGYICYNELLRGIRGEMNSFRRALVDKAFERLDIDQSGILESSDIKGLYNPSKHPAVMEGRKTEDQVLQEFLETFELHHNIRVKQEKDYKVTREEFHEYYNNISASIDSDEYFEVMMNNSWNLTGKAATYKAQKPWAQEIGKQVPKQRTGMESPDSPFKKAEPERRKEEGKYSHKKVMEEVKTSPVKPTDSKVRFGNVVATDLPKYQNIMLERFRTKLVGRGGKGIIGLEKQFKIFDLDGSGDLCKDEFKKAINDYKLGMDERDLDNLFKMFDKNMDGKIDYEEFMTTMIGSMSEFRRNMVERAFSSLDPSEEGSVDLSLLKKSFNAKMHPDVKSGKKSEEEVIYEFESTFDSHHSGYGGTEVRVSREEFIVYYTKLSAAVESDTYFDNMMTDVWGLGLRSNVDKLPYAGVCKKVYQVDSKAIWNYDHHKTMFSAQHPLRHGEEPGASGYSKSIYEASEIAKGAGKPSFAKGRPESKAPEGIKE